MRPRRPGRGVSVSLGLALALASCGAAGVGGPRDLEVTESGAFHGDGWWTFAAVVENPNGGLMARSVTAELHYRDGSGTELGSERRTISLILPSRRMAVTAMVAADQPVEEVEVSLEVGTWQPVNATGLRMADVERAAITDGGAIRMELSSPGGREMADIALAAVVRDRDGRVVGGMSDLVDISDGLEVVLSFPSPHPTAASVEVFTSPTDATFRTH